MTPKTDDEAVRSVIAIGKARGYLTYGEMNKQLPDDADPEKLASLLMTLDEMGVELLDEAQLDTKSRKHGSANIYIPVNRMSLQDQS